MGIEGGRGIYKLKPETVKEVQANAAPVLDELLGTRPVLKGSYSMGYNRMLIKTCPITANDRGAIIGNGGKQINQIRIDSGAQCSIDTPEDGLQLAVLKIRGTMEQIEAAEKLIGKLLETVNSTPSKPWVHGAGPKPESKPTETKKDQGSNWNKDNKQWNAASSASSSSWQPPQGGQG